MADDGRRRANIELKARCRDPVRAAEIAEQLGASLSWIDVQTDTYFSLGAYRMKLRESVRGRHELIWYERANRHGARKSTYRVLCVPDPEEKKRIFAKSMGIKAVVRKDRTLYLWRGVRVHIDRVDGLGDFVEFEAVLGPDLDEEEGRRRVETLKRQLGIHDEDLVSVSYSDLVAHRPQLTR